MKCASLEIQKHFYFVKPGSKQRVGGGGQSRCLTSVLGALLLSRQTHHTVRAHAKHFTLVHCAPHSERVNVLKLSAVIGSAQ